MSGKDPVLDLYVAVVAWLNRCSVVAKGEALDCRNKAHEAVEELVRLARIGAETEQVRSLHNDGADIKAYAIEIESLFLSSTQQARWLTRKEADLVGAWYKQGVPTDVIKGVFLDACKNPEERPMAGIPRRPVKSLRYFNEAVIERWAAVK